MKAPKVIGNTEIFLDPEVTLIPLSQIKMRGTEWLWPGRIPRGKLVLFGGQPSTGKTTAALSIIASETRCSRFPLSEHRGNGGEVIIFSAEDDAADTIAPRLVAAGGDLEKVFVQQTEYTSENSAERFGLLSQDLALLESTLRARRNIALVMFDPLNAYVGARDAHQDAAMREVLGPVCQLAADYGVTILGITHLNKSEGMSAMARFTGSTATIAAARAAFLFAKYEGNSVMVAVKSNLAEMPPALTYRIESVLLTEHEPPIPTSRTAWLDELELSADDALGNGKDSRTSACDDACDFIEAMLLNGPVSAKSAEEQLTKAGHSQRTWKRAKATLGIVSDRDRFSGGWHWFMPEQHRLWKENKEGQFRDDSPRVPNHLAPLADPKNANFPQDPEVGTLGKKIELKPNSSNTSSQGCQQNRHLALLAAETELPAPKSANSRQTGNSWHPWLISEVLNNLDRFEVSAQVDPLKVVH